MDAIRFEHEANDGFYRVVKERVNDHFRRTGKSRFADHTILLKAVLFGGAIEGSYALILLHPFPLWTLLPLAFVFGVTQSLDGDQHRPRCRPPCPVPVAVLELTLLGIVRSHFRFRRAMGRPPVKRIETSVSVESGAILHPRCGREVPTSREGFALRSA